MLLQGWRNRACRRGLLPAAAARLPQSTPALLATLAPRVADRAPPTPPCPPSAAGESNERLPTPAQLEAATGLSAQAVEAAQAAVRAMLQGDTSAISGEGEGGLRVLCTQTDCPALPAQPRDVSRASLTPYAPCILLPPRPPLLLTLLPAPPPPPRLQPFASSSCCLSGWVPISATQPAWPPPPAPP